MFLFGCELRTDNKNYNEHVYSHRGASGEETEHTLESYDLAVLYGSKYIEQDIVQSLDGTLYVSHDLSALRMTGFDKLFSQMKDLEINKLKTEDGHSILNLEEVFDHFRNNPSIQFVVELKEKKCVDALCKLIEQYDYSNRVIVQCCELDVLKTIKDRYPNMPTLFLVFSLDEFEEALTLDYVDIISVNKGNMTEENCIKAHEHGKQFNVWTLNTMEEIKAAIVLQVDTYFTDYTAKALTLEEQYFSLRT